MTIINIRRGIKDGKKFCVFTVGGTECITASELANASDLLTDTFTPEGFGHRGIFTNGSNHDKGCHIEFRYGDERKSFVFPVIDFNNQDASTIEKLLRNRLCQVREWVKSIDQTEELEFVV